MKKGLKMNSKILSIGTAVPRFSAEQNRILEFMIKAYDDDLAARKLKALFRFSGINKRHSVIPDFGNGHDPEFFKYGIQQPDVQKRMAKFQQNAAELSLEAVANTMKNSSFMAEDVTHLITVTCTGLSSPGLNAEIISRLSLRKDIFNTSVNFMGCGAAFHALKMADFIIGSDANAVVLIVCTELCTLHFLPKTNTDNLLSNTIFGDGSAGVLMSNKNRNEKGLLLKGFYSLFLEQGHHLMGWNVNPAGFEMELKAEVPDFIGDEINEAIEKASGYYKLKPSDIRHWAVHPGGKKILDQIRSMLGLSNNELQHSYDVLREYGNMSSPTILFVLNEMMRKIKKEDENILAIGFGPGLSIETSLLSYA